MSERKISKDRKELFAGALFFVAAVVLIAFVGARQNISARETGTYLLRARFNVVDGVGIGAPVNVAGIRIGRVVGEKLDSSYGVIVTMSIVKNVRLPEDTGASVHSTSLVGTKYIELSPGGSDDYLEDGGEITFTEDSINMIALLDKVLAMAKDKKAKTQQEGVDK